MSQGEDSPTDDVVGEARQWFDFVTSMQREDAEQGRLRYHLLRLTACGLRHEDLPALLELGRLAFQGSDVADQVARIDAEAGASALARVIADVVGRTGSAGGPTREVMLGAVLGAYLAVARSQIRDEAAVQGAVAAASAAWAASMIDEFRLSSSRAEYVSPGEG